MSDHIIPKRTYYLIFAALVVLTAVTVAVAYYDLGFLNTIVAISIAALKAALIITYFMHARYGNRLVWVFVICGVLWLGVLLALTMSDYATRGWTSG